jgi:hypothetical protein
VARREHPRDIPVDNPFEKMNITYKPQATRPVTHAELTRFVEAADKCGYPSIGTAAQIAFFWLQRQTDIIHRLTWGHYRPNDAPDCVRVRHHKTDQVVDIPLYDSDGSSLWPELTSRLDAMERRGSLIIMRDKPDRKRKIYLPWREDHFRHCVAEIRTAAGLDPSVKFMGIRHGGNTEGANAGLSDAQLRALSGHKSNAALLRYAQSTKEQRVQGARLRRSARTKGGHLSE